MRALFIGSYPNPVVPHLSVFFQNLVHEMAGQNVECIVISPVSITKYKHRIMEIPEHEYEELPNNKRVEVFRPRYVSFSAKKIGIWNTMKLTQASFDMAVLSYVKKMKIKFDFVYGHFFLGGGLTAAKVGRQLNVPAYIAYGECNFDTEIRNKYGDIKTKEMAGVHGIIAVSSDNLNDLKNRKFAENIPTLLSINAVNKNLFKPKNKIECRRKFGFNMEDFIVGFVGYFIERKGHKRVLNACGELENVKLAFAGRGDDIPSGENVVFCESLNHSEIPDFLNAIDVFVLPTLHEGCCNAVIEAMSCGKAIVSSDRPFNHDILNVNNAILVDPMSEEQIREAIRKLRDDEEECIRLGEKALKDAELLSIDNRVRNILSFIQRTK